MSRPCSDNFEGSAVWYLERGSQEPTPLTKGKHIPDNATVLALPYHPEQEPPPREMFDWNTPENVFRFVSNNGTLTASRSGFFAGVDADLRFDIPETSYERAPKDALLGVLRNHTEPVTAARTEHRITELRAALETATDRKQLRELDYQAHSLAIEHGVSEELYSLPLAQLSPVAKLRVEVGARLLALDGKHSVERYLQAFDLRPCGNLTREELQSRAPVVAAQLFAVHEVRSSFDDSYDTYAGEVIESVWPTWEQAKERAELITLRDQLQSCVTYYGGTVEASAAPLVPSLDGDELRRHARLDIPLPATGPAVEWESGCAWVVISSEENTDHGPSTLCRVGGVFPTRAEAEARASSFPSLITSDGPSHDSRWVDNTPIAQSSGTPVFGLFDAAPGERVGELPKAALDVKPAATVVAYPVQ